MRFFLFLGMCLLLQGCSANLRILDVNFEKCGNFIFLRVVTDKDIYQYDNSIFAYKVWLEYAVNQKDMSGSPAAGFPFIALRDNNYRKQAEEERGWISKWKIPFKNHTSLSGKIFSYNLVNRDINTISMRFYGATMAWGKITSLPYTIRLIN